MLRTYTDLAKCLEASAQILLPEHIAESIQELLKSGELPIPDKSTLSRFRLSFDGGWMKCMRNFNSVFAVRSILDLPARALSTDSSEQLGQDWLPTMYAEVFPEHLQEMAAAADSMAQFFQTYAADVERLVESGQEDAATAPLELPEEQVACCFCPTSAFSAFINVKRNASSAKCPNMFQH